MTPWQSHKQKWSTCTQCSLCSSRRSVVLARGHIPADILFVGEAPGASEDVLGLPFTGPAGHLLNGIIEASGATEYRYALTNLVACIPRGEDYEKTTEPPRESIKACEPRLVEFVRICKPRLIVCVGALAKKHIHGQAQFALPHEHDQPHWLDGEPMLFTDITHPAAILRSNVAMRGLMVQKATVVLAEAVSQL